MNYLFWNNKLDNSQNNKKFIVEKDHFQLLWTILLNTLVLISRRLSSNGLLSSIIMLNSSNKRMTNMSSKIIFSVLTIILDLQLNLACQRNSTLSQKLKLRSFLLVKSLRSKILTLLIVSKIKVLFISLITQFGALKSR